jgi:hypothetical protein
VEISSDAIRWPSPTEHRARLASAHQQRKPLRPDSNLARATWQHPDPQHRSRGKGARADPRRESGRRISRERREAALTFPDSTRYARVCYHLNLTRPRDGPRATWAQGNHHNGLRTGFYANMSRAETAVYLVRIV